jgi:aspartate racemase
MKTLGIVGGLGPESTIEYYRFILDGYRARVPDGSAPHLIIDSLDVNRGLAMLEANDLLSLASYLSASVERLARAGAEIALIAANTPHLVFNEVARQAPIPMLSIVQATCDQAGKLGFKRLGLLGTGFTMRAKFYPEVIHQIYIQELIKNIFKPESRAAIIDIIERLRRETGIVAVILAGTELPLLLRGAEPEGLTFLDTTLIHVATAIDAIIS